MTIDAATMHFAPSVWGPDPEKFDPERWTDTRERQRLDHYMVAFSKGTRICLGIKYVPPPCFNVSIPSVSPFPRHPPFQSSCKRLYHPFLSPRLF